MNKNNKENPINVTLLKATKTTEIRSPINVQFEYNPPEHIKLINVKFVNMSPNVNIVALEKATLTTSVEAVKVVKTPNFNVAFMDMEVENDGVEIA